MRYFYFRSEKAQSIREARARLASAKQSERLNYYSAQCCDDCAASYARDVAEMESAADSLSLIKGREVLDNEKF